MKLVLFFMTRVVHVVNYQWFKWRRLIPYSTIEKFSVKNLRRKISGKISTQKFFREWLWWHFDDSDEIWALNFDELKNHFEREQPYLWWWMQSTVRHASYQHAANVWMQIECPSLFVLLVDVSGTHTINFVWMKKRSVISRVLLWAPRWHFIMHEMISIRIK